MDKNRAFERLKNQLRKAEEILREDEEALKVDPNNFAKKLVLASFTHHVTDLRNQVAEFLLELEKEKLHKKDKIKQREIA